MPSRLQYCRKCGSIGETVEIFFLSVIWIRDTLIDPKSGGGPANAARVAARVIQIAPLHNSLETNPKAFNSRCPYIAIQSLTPATVRLGLLQSFIPILLPRDSSPVKPLFHCYCFIVYAGYVC